MSYKTLKQFILRSEVLKLYRSFLRLSYKVENIERRKELQKWIRFDFESNKNHTEEEAIKMMISRGKMSLREMEQTIMIANGKENEHSNNSKGSADASCQALSSADIVASTMPFLHFQGTLVYSYHYSDCACISQDILSSLGSSEKAVIGFDMEWPVSYQRNSKDKTALIQMCLSDKICYLFQVYAMPSFPKPLESLILDERVILVGLNIASDMWKLARDFDIKVKMTLDKASVVDICTLANQRLKSTERWNLDGLCRNILRHRLNKVQAVRCGDWTETPLSDEQKLYAATDALASLLIYQKLQLKFKLTYFMKLFFFSKDCCVCKI
ncbi:hypothetical protein Btru_001122 [Bulinus truncatus]|nr:hypothetical protein Btru_001122 [Bulinus truncatus]